MVSVIVPAYNEASRIARTLQHLVDHAGDYSICELVVVDDGSRDATAEIARTVAATSPVTVRVIQHAVNRGKGAAVRTGLDAAEGEAIAFLDADLSVEPAYLPAALQRIEQGADMVIGTRRGKREASLQVTQPWRRRIAGAAYSRMQRLLVGLDFEDTQCPFKLMTREARDRLHDARTIEGWGFDVELLVVARRSGLRIVEMPVPFEHVEGSKVGVTPATGVRVLREMLRIRRVHGAA